MNRRPASASQHVLGSAELIEQATHDSLSASGGARRRETLWRVITASKQLARSLDALARQYDEPTAAEPSAVHVALDQAAAAAEDVATCAKVAVQALDERT